jgi:hypothetical protein
MGIVLEITVLAGSLNDMLYAAALPFGLSYEKLKYIDVFWLTVTGLGPVHATWRWASNSIALTPWLGVFGITFIAKRGFES